MLFSFYHLKFAISDLDGMAVIEPLREIWMAHARDAKSRA